MAGTASQSIMTLSEDDAAALLADLERLQQENGAAEAANREYKAKLERFRKERSMGTSFDGQGGGASADRGGTAVTTTMGPMWTRGVSVGGGLGQDLSYVPWGVVQNSPRNTLKVFVDNQGLGHTLSPDTPQITVISCVYVCSLGRLYHLEATF